MIGITNGIVVGLDGSNAAQQALDWAIGEAARRGLPVRAIVVSTATNAADIAAAGVTRALAHLPNGHDLDVDYATSPGSPGHELVRATQAAALLVIGAEGAGRRQRHLLGSTVRHCLHHSRADVAVIRPRSGVGSASRIVVGTDGSTAADEAIRWAGEAAQAYGSPLVAARAWVHTDVRHGDSNTSADELSQRRWSEATNAQVRRQLAAVLGERQPLDTTVEAPEGAPVRALLDLLRPDDLLVVGSRGLGAVRDLMLGSVSRACAEHAPCSVVVVRAP